MKRIMIALLMLVVGLPAFAQDKAADAKLLADLMAKEKTLWDAFFKKDTKPFAEMLADDGVYADGMGLSTKAELLKTITSVNCKIKNYSYAQQKLTRLDKDAVILSFKATQDGECDGQKVPATSYVTSTWVMRNGKWVGISHAEIPAMPMAPAPAAKKK